MATGCVVSRSKVLLVPDINRVVSFTCLTLIGKNNEERYWTRRANRHCRHYGNVPKDYNTPSDTSASTTQNTSPSNTSSDTGVVTLEIDKGVPKVSVPLPSLNRNILFSLRPYKNTVGDLMSMIKKEDPSIGILSIQTKGGTQMAASNSIEDLIEDDFQMTINDKNFYVKIPERDMKKIDLDKLADIRQIVNQLYTALNVPDYLVNREKELEELLEAALKELEPLETARKELDLKAHRKTNWLAWFGLGYMSIQFGILARLTWWEYSWDIMEPVTYFVTYGTSMAAYAYYVLTKQEYILPEVSDRQHLIDFHQRAKKAGFDLEQYNKLKATVVQLESDLKRIKDPLLPYIPPRPRPTINPYVLKKSSLSSTKQNVFLFFKNLIKSGSPKGGHVPFK